jgi:20S proteasome subunit alpha 5
MFDKNEYDRNVNTFSNQGRLYQVEYAMKAVEQGSTTLGIQTKDGVILAAEKKISSKLQIPSSIRNILPVNDSCICTYSGLSSDARALVDTARVEAANHWFTFNEDMPAEAISLAVCDQALSFAEKKKKKNQNDKKRQVSRPYGVALLVAGIDKDGSPKLFKNDPSGNYVRFKACCIGQGGENGMSTLQSIYKEDMKWEDAINLAGKVLKENLEQKINKENVEISYIKKDDKKIVYLTPEQIEQLLPNF